MEITAKNISINSIEKAKHRLDNIAKPLKSLGKLETSLIKLSGIFGTDQFVLDKKALVVMCADNGVVFEGVTQTGQEVTKIVAENMTQEKSTVSIMCKKADTDIFVVDIGMSTDSDNLHIINKKKMYGTNNFAKEPAMSKEVAISAINSGIEMVKNLSEQGYKIIATGEMGIGNTSTSSAITACLLQKSAKEVTGVGAGLTSKALLHKIEVIENALKMHKPNKNDAIDVISKVGGLDIAGLTGVFLGGAIYGVPIVIDGFISSVSALLATIIEPKVKDFIFASHVSKEPAGQMLLQSLDLEPMLTLDMCLGEGTGAVMAFNIFDMAIEIYQKMADFKDVNIEAYVELK